MHRFCSSSEGRADLESQLDNWISCYTRFHLRPAVKNTFGFIPRVCRWLAIAGWRWRWAMASEMDTNDGFMVSIRMPALTPSQAISLWPVIVSIVAAAVALFLPCVLLCLFVALGLYTFLFTHHRASALCVEISPNDFYIFIQQWSCKFEPKTGGRQHTFLCLLARVGQSQMWLMISIQANAAPIAPFYNNSGHMYIQTVHMYSNLGRPLCHLPFHCTIAQCLLQLYFIYWFFFFYIWDDFALRFWHWKQSEKFVKTLTLAAQPAPLSAGIY